jgi:cysteine desulfurase/selenocysteine lyase
VTDSDRVSESIPAEEWRREFTIVDKCVYLDHATQGPLPKPTVEAMHASIALQATTASLGFTAAHSKVEEVRARFAALIGADCDEIALTSSTAMGINIVAKGLPWQEGNSVVVPAFDFPSNIYPWMHLKTKGVELRRIRPRNGQITVEDLLAACDSSTRVIAVSLVQFSNGSRIDIGELGEVCRSRGILLVVDGMQAVGWANINVHALPIDAMSLQSYKWLLGPFAVGWLYVRRELIDRIEPLAVGSRSMTPQESFLDHRFEFSPTATRYESGVLNIHGVLGAGASIDLLRRIGMSAIETRVLSLADHLADGLVAKNCTIDPAPENRRERSPIVAFRHPLVDARTCHRRLTEAGVGVSLREGAVRVSPHFYNTLDDIERLLDALP